MNVLAVSKITGVIVEYIAFLAACCTYRYHDRTFRIVYYLLLFIVLFETTGLYISFNLSLAQRLKTIGLPNLYLIVESFAVYILAVKTTTNRFYRATISLTTGLFLVYWALNLYLNGIYVFPTTPFLLFSVNGLIIFLGIIIRQFEAKDLFRQPLLYLGAGMIIFYGCTMPYFSVVSYFAKSDNETLKKLVQILFISNYMRYSLTAAGYIILYRQEKAKRLSLATAD